MEIKTFLLKFRAYYVENHKPTHFIGSMKDETKSFYKKNTFEFTNIVFYAFFSPCRRDGCFRR